MDSPFDFVKDSSVWFKPSSLSTINTLDNRLYLGIIREARNETNTNELRYLVEIRHKNDIILCNCRMLRRWGGVYNYEDFTLHGYNYNDASNNQNGVAAIAGDAVLVGLFGGSGREGVILGGLTHMARKSFLDIKKGPQYKSEFNGIETSINEDGEWTLTFKGQPTNKDKLNDTPSQPISAPQYNKDVGTSYMKWDKEGGYTLSDEATDGDKAQKLHIDKKKGTIDIFSGKINLNFKKNGQKVSLTNKETLFTSKDSITYKTKKFYGEASTEIRVKTPLYVIETDKVRLGDEGATEWLVIGSTFRQAEKTMNEAVKTQLQAAQTALAAAQVALGAAGGAMVVPIAGPIVAAPNVTAAGAAILQAGTALNLAATAIGAYESGGATHDYLSKVSKTK